MLTTSVYMFNNKSHWKLIQNSFTTCACMCVCVCYSFFLVKNTFHSTKFFGKWWMCINLLQQPYQLLKKFSIWLWLITFLLPSFEVDLNFFSLSLFFQFCCCVWFFDFYSFKEKYLFLSLRWVCCNLKPRMDVFKDSFLHHEWFSMRLAEN